MFSFYPCFGRACLAALTIAGLAACGTVTGVPSHGGGKRFAIEQELITASARAALRSIDLRALSGHSVRIVFSSIGDEGSGNLAGGRMALDRLIRGDYSIGGTTRTTESGGITKQALPGASIATGVSILTDGPPGYRSDAFINPRDVDFLSTLVASHLIFNGAKIKTNPNEAVDYLVIVLVDVFGTIRDRTDYLIYNQERLRARAAIEIAAIRPEDGSVLIPPSRGAAEAMWEESYVMWTGPTSTSRSLHLLDDLLMPNLPTALGRAGSTQIAPPTVAPSRVQPNSDLPHPVTKPDTKPRTNPPFR